MLLILTFVVVEQGICSDISRHQGGWIPGSVITSVEHVYL